MLFERPAFPVGVMDFRHEPETNHLAKLNVIVAVEGKNLVDQRLGAVGGRLKHVFVNALLAQFRTIDRRQDGEKRARDD